MIGQYLPQNKSTQRVYYTLGKGTYQDLHISHRQAREFPGKVFILHEPTQVYTSLLKWQMFSLFHSVPLSPLPLLAPFLYGVLLHYFTSVGSCFLLFALYSFSPSYMTYLISFQSYISATRCLFSLSNPFLSPVSTYKISSAIYVVNKDTTRFSFTCQACVFCNWKLRISKITSNVRRIASFHQQSFPIWMTMTFSGLLQ